MTYFQLLANAIIEQAAADYREALQNLASENEKKKKAAKATIREIEKFFSSKWYGILTKVDGEYLLERLRAEVLQPV